MREATNAADVLRVAGLLIGGAGAGMNAASIVTYYSVDKSPSPEFYNVAMELGDKLFAGGVSLSLMSVALGTIAVALSRPKE